MKCNHPCRRLTQAQTVTKLALKVNLLILRWAIQAVCMAIDDIISMWAKMTGQSWSMLTQFTSVVLVFVTCWSKTNMEYLLCTLCRYNCLTHSNYTTTYILKLEIDDACLHIATNLSECTQTVWIPCRKIMIMSGQIWGWYCCCM